MIWQLYLVLFVVLVWTMVLRRSRRAKQGYQHVQSSAPCLPLIGHAYKFLGTDETQMKAYQYFGREAIKNGRHTSVWIGDLEIVVVVDPEDVEFITRNCLEKGVLMDSIRFTTGNGSIFAPVPIWRRRRKILLPTFSSKNLYQFQSAFSQQAAIMADQLDCMVGKGAFSTWYFFTTYSMDAICETTLGIELRSQMNHDHPFLRNLELGSRLTAARIVRPWEHNDLLYRLNPNYYAMKRVLDYLHGFIYEIITKKRKELKQRAENKNFVEAEYMKPFLELLIEASALEKERAYSDEELREEILVLMVAGTDTSAVGAAFTTLMLARHPHEQDKVYEELKEVFGSSDRLVVPEDLPRLKYLEQAIKESLRLYPPVPLVTRQAEQPVTLPSGMTVTREHPLMLNIWAIHRNPRYWGADAEVFRPSRWDQPLAHPAQFMLFGYGTRNCAGECTALSPNSVTGAG
ncbi:cytochrome p450 domain-containing protein [Phthorimaea operculella]|nr:cytochrome p450 domain-containing protein [Phthorimaea operculella]